MCKKFWPKEIGLRLRKSPSAALLLASFFLLSCSSQSSSGESKKSEIIERLLNKAEQRKAMSGTIYATSTDPSGKSVTAPGVFLVKWPDRVRLEIQDPVGGVQMLLVIHGSSFWLYRNNHPYNLMGPIERLPSEVKLAFRSEDLVRALLARPNEEALKRAEYSENEAVLESEGSLATWSWNSRSGLLEKMSFQEPSGWKSKAEYEDYEMRGGVFYPTKLRLTREPSRGPVQSTLLVWREWDPSVSEEKKLFQIPQQSSFGRKTKALP